MFGAKSVSALALYAATLQSLTQLCSANIIDAINLSLDLNDLVYIPPFTANPNFVDIFTQDTRVTGL